MDQISQENSVLRNLLIPPKKNTNFRNLFVEYNRVLHYWATIHDRSWPVMTGHDWSWLIMTGHDRKEYEIMFGHARSWPVMPGHGWPLMTGHDRGHDWSGHEQSWLTRMTATKNTWKLASARPKSWPVTCMPSHTQSWSIMTNPFIILESAYKYLSRPFIDCIQISNTEK